MTKICKIIYETILYLSLVVHITRFAAKITLVFENKFATSVTTYYIYFQILKLLHISKSRWHI